MFASVCADLGAELVELDGEDDHVRLLVASPPQVAVARLVNSLKGVSARRLRQRYRCAPAGAPVIPVVVRGLGWWRTAGDPQGLPASTPPVGRANPALKGQHAHSSSSG